METIDAPVDGFVVIPAGNGDLVKRIAGAISLIFCMSLWIRQFLYSQAWGLKRFLELQSPPPVQPKLFDS